MTLRTPRAIMRYALVLVFVLVCGVIGLKSASTSPHRPYDKASLLDLATINFVRPGLIFQVASASIAQDGTITARVKVTDANGLPLDRLGVDTPGVVSMSLICATIPNGQTQYKAYTTSANTGTLGTVNRPAADSGGVFVTNADGDYTYTFKTKAPVGFDATATHTIGVYGNRNLVSFLGGSSYASTTFNFVPNGAKVTVVRDVIRDASCNRCHDELYFHGGSRVGVAMCVLCHQPQLTDSNTGASVDFPVLIHKVHYGVGLTQPYTIGTPAAPTSLGAGVTFPADGGNSNKNFITGKATVNGGVEHCEVCHDQTTGATQATAYLTNPNRAACGACHDYVNFATGANHVNLVESDDSQCKMCHIPQGAEFDASIKGTHTIPTYSTQLPGINFKILKVANGTAGNTPTVTYSVTDNAGKPISLAELKVSPGRLALVLAGSTFDYGGSPTSPINFGTGLTTKGYVSEDATNGTCGSDGTCNYTFTHAIPASATGTYTVMMEGRRAGVLNAGTTKQISMEYGAAGVKFDFSVDGSPVVARRQVVDIATCNNCHVRLSLHGENRNQITQCVICHNTQEDDSAVRGVSTVAADKALPPQSISFAAMIHKVHTGALYAAAGKPYVIVGFGGSHNDFANITFPAFGTSLTPPSTSQGQLGDVRKCYLCHGTSGSELNLPSTHAAIKDQQGFINPIGATASACTGCHQHSTIDTASHVLANTTILGESCDVCHDSGAQFSPDKVHAEVH